MMNNEKNAVNHTPSIYFDVASTVCGNVEGRSTAPMR
jgi:hypothetical protein